MFLENQNNLLNLFCTTEAPTILKARDVATIVIEIEYLLPIYNALPI